MSSIETRDWPARDPRRIATLKYRAEAEPLSPEGGAR